MARTKTGTPGGTQQPAPRWGVLLRFWAPGSRQATRLRALFLFLAILPMLTFAGHWPAIRIDIPGTNLYVGVPEAPVADETEPHSHGPGTHDGDSGHAHEQHCHTGVARCSDVPFTGFSAFALMDESAAYLGAAALLTLLAVLAWSPTQDRSVIPSLQPPRSFAA
ncbi:MAG: hypothetical protein IT303_19190 [Dehalococcoidia bacterium]|nr:hypothetical protein [Dehalococcoidia bacterium]